MKFSALKTGYKVGIIIIIFLVAFRLLLPTLVKSYVNKKLNNLPGYTGHVDDIDIHLIRGAYVINGLVLKKTTDPVKYPFLQINECDLSIEWKALFKGRLVGEVVMNNPAMYIHAATADISKEPSREHWTATLKALMPMTINRLQVNNGKVAYLDL